MKKQTFLLSLFIFQILLFFSSADVFAQKKKTNSVSESRRSNLRWDLGASVGSYAGSSYSEIDLGLNWYLLDSINFRNVLFSRFGNSSNSASGLDSSLRFEYADQTEGGGMGFRFFAGPGVRISNANNSGVFGEAGAIFKLGGLNIGGGVKALSYTSPGKDTVTGQTLPSTDVSYFVVLSGGGTL